MDSNGNYIHPDCYLDKKEKILAESQPITQQRTAFKVQSVPNKAIINNLSRALKSNSSYVNCPYCNHQALTKTSKNMNMVNLLRFIFTVIIGWAFWQCCRGKDFNCYNVDHFCLKCDAKLADYNAC